MALLGVNEAHVQIATLRAASKDAPNVVSSNVRCRRQSEAVILMSLQLEHIGAGQGHYSQPFQLYNYAQLLSYYQRLQIDRSRCTELLQT